VRFRRGMSSGDCWLVGGLAEAHARARPGGRHGQGVTAPLHSNVKLLHAVEKYFRRAQFVAGPGRAKGLPEKKKKVQRERERERESFIRNNSEERERERERDLLLPE